MESAEAGSTAGRWPRAWLWAGLLAGALARLYFGAGELGVSWPDEIHQSLEPAHRAAFGYGLVAWEFREGARGWAFPGLLAGALKLLSGLGADHPSQYLLALRLYFIALSVATGWACHRLARAVGASELAATAAATAYGLIALTLYFSHRAMSETASALPVALGLAWVLGEGEDGRRWRRLAGAGLLALAVLLRLQNGVFCVAALGLLGAQRRWRDAAQVGAVLFCGALVYGLLDWVTWGRPFHSAIVYLRFNVIEGKASLFGRSPALYYLKLLSSFTLAPALAVLAILGLGARGRGARGVVLTGIAFVFLLSRVPHKELRFILTAVPLLYVGVALGLDVLAKVAPRRVLAGALVAVSLFSTFRTPSLTFGELGQYEEQRPHDRAWGDFAAVNRLLLSAHSVEDLCGLKVEAAHLAWTGGSSHLHREVPIYQHHVPRESGHFNYLLTHASLAQGLPVVRREGEVVLAKLPVERCLPDPAYAWELP